MNFSTVMAVATLTVAMAASAHAQTRSTPPHPVPAPSTSETTQAPYNQPLPAAPAVQPPRLFTIAGVPVDVWAPVESPYNSHMNRDQAANPLWEEADAY